MSTSVTPKDLGLSYGWVFKRNINRKEGRARAEKQIDYLFINFFNMLC